MQEKMPIWVLEELLELIKQTDANTEEIEAWEAYQAMADDDDDLPVIVNTPPKRE